MQKKLKLEIPILLPDIDHHDDQCVERLQNQLKDHKGVEHAHVDQSNHETVLCLHFDPNLITLEQVNRFAKQAGADLTAQFKHETLRITNMDCADCASSIEHILGRLQGVISVSVNYAAEKMRVEYDVTVILHDAIVRRIHAIGYRVEDEKKEETWLDRHWGLLLAMCSGIFLGTGFIGEAWLSLPRTAAVMLYVLAYLTGGYDAARHGIHAALKLRFDIDVLMVVAAIGAAVLGDWPEGALLLFLFSLGHALEHYAMDRARRAIASLGQVTPKMARRRRDGSETEVPVEELERGDLVVVRTGERIPVDGRVIDGNSAVDESPITGESIPVEKTAGNDVFAGSLNGDGSLEVEVSRLARDTTLARVVQMVEEAQTQKSPTQRFTEKFESIFVPVILVGVVIVIIIPPIWGWLTWSDSFLRSMTILVAASPCALAIATPAAILAGIAQAARNGVLIKGGVHLEMLGRLKAMAFDKTGTITRGEPEITDIVPYSITSQDELLRTVAAVESRSSHPLARAVVRSASDAGLDLPEANNVNSIVGQGVEAILNGKRVQIGNLDLFAHADGSSLPQDIVNQVKQLQEEGKTTMVVTQNDRPLGVIALADRPREQAKRTLDQLGDMGLNQLIMLTGDNERVATAISREVGLTEYRASLLPDEKVAAVKDYLVRFGYVAMLGDGVNDAPALTASSVGIAMGTGGSDVALETADVALMADDLSKLPFAVGLGRQTRAIIRQNLVVSLGVIALLIPAALLGVAGIGVAIIFHEGSTLLVVANALRLLAYQPRIET
ncbi:MAG: cadmium-transporting ATPase [Gimesia sp.]|nr:cadmium-transporting ATPase [Gimesia sp.]|tara:strand:- start:13457 stop:15811 length:2355 start_codon:yes stop_codon:yes gene_type:complete